MARCWRNVDEQHPFSEGRERGDTVVSHDDPGVGQVELPRSSLEGKNAAERLPADLVLHVVRVWEGADDDLAVRVSCGADAGPPAVEGGVPGDDHHPGVADISG